MTITRLEFLELMTSAYCNKDNTLSLLKLSEFVGFAPIKTKGKSDYSFLNKIIHNHLDEYRKSLSIKNEAWKLIVTRYEYTGEILEAFVEIINHADFYKEDLIVLAGNYCNSLDGFREFATAERKKEVARLEEEGLLCSKLTKSVSFRVTEDQYEKLSIHYNRSEYLRSLL